jgi:hypothetical protein
LNCKIAKEYNLEADKLTTTMKCRDICKIWAEYKGKPRKEVVQILSSRLDMTA